MGDGIMRVKNFFLSALILLLALSLPASGKKDEEKDLLDNLDLFTDVVTLVDEDYYRDVEPGDLMMGAVGGMMASLDRYSYIKKEGEVGSAGIGIEFAIIDNLLTVVSAVEGGPAAKAGIIHGDRIVKVNGDLMRNVTLDDIRRMVRGAPGDEVKLTLYREGMKGTNDVVLQMQEVTPPGMVECIPLEDATGYMRLASFPAGSGREFIKGVEGLTKDGVLGLVIDLRDNPGGDIDEAAAVAGYLIGDGKKIASIESRLESERKEISAPSAPPPDVSIVVLINGGTASEAEVVAGALKEAGKAVLIGSTTFGDGSIQKDIPLEETLYLHLTVGRYAVSGEDSFDGDGIEPDVEVLIGPGKESLLQQIREGVDVDEKDIPADSQLEMAVDLIKGIEVLGGESK